MAAVFFHHVVGDLTVGKPEVVELHDTDTLDAAARAIAASPEGAVPVWRLVGRQVPRDDLRARHRHVRGRFRRR